MRFSYPGDLVSSMDMNAQPIWKAPVYNTDLITNSIKVYKDLSLDNIKNTFEIIKPENLDPMGLHTISGFSEQSKPMDYLKSVVEGAVVYIQISGMMYISNHLFFYIFIKSII